MSAELRPSAGPPRSSLRLIDSPAAAAVPAPASRALWIAAEIAGGLAGGYAALVLAAHHGFTFYFAVGSPLGEVLALSIVAVVAPLGAAAAAWYVATFDDSRSFPFRRAVDGAYLGAAAAVVASAILLATQTRWVVAGNAVGAEILGIAALPALSAVGAVLALERGASRISVVPAVSLRGGEGAPSLALGVALRFGGGGAR